MRLIARNFLRHGYVRGPIPERLLQEGWRVYKKGWELRLLLPADAGAVADARRAIDRAGFRLARFYPKGNQLVQPIYGREAVLQVLEAAGIDVTDM